ncbi:hypothetical protein M378DRAFT_872616 [Amanita muscaria Koide BX008]|uniref:Uncharacterized protein n=1 Tax=Amanita muscaria (strain Koide BX008) TaxID=946122 RepID=A0A0C2SDJ7_AMAMK|nr:hypothetical protein M378DRAFT_872616 [Amanita muscaria Koide BX008]
MTVPSTRNGLAKLQVTNDLGCDSSTVLDSESAVFIYLSSTKKFKNPVRLAEKIKSFTRFCLKMADFASGLTCFFFGYTIQQYKRKIIQMIHCLTVYNARDERSMYV